MRVAIDSRGDRRCRIGHRETPGKDANELTNARILIVDNESGAAHLEECLKSLGYTVCAAVSSGRRALERVASARPDLALVDLGLEGEPTGPETGERIGRRFEVPVVYLTGEAGGELLRRARATGPFGYLLRPFEKGQLHLSIQAALCGYERERNGHGGGVIVFRDVTRRRLAEEALARAFAQGRSEIVDTILHNIGNAINSVATGIETVRRSLVNDPGGRRLLALAAAVQEHREDWLDYIANDPQGRKVMPFIVELAESSSRRNEELMKTVGRVRDRANHIADIVRTQKALAGPGLARKDVDLHEALSGAVRVLRDSLNQRGIQVAIECDGAPQRIRIEESQFHQMLVNLVKNSLEAINDLAAAQGLDETPLIRIRARAGEESLDLEVADNGIGIGNKDTRELFSPGYTTKESGSGLGLHSAANFVIGLGGRIQPLSEGTGKGTTMRVTLPLSSVAPQATAGERQQ